MANPTKSRPARRSMRCVVSLVAVLMIPHLVVSDGSLARATGGGSAANGAKGVLLPRQSALLLALIHACTEQLETALQPVVGCRGGKHVRDFPGGVRRGAPVPRDGERARGPVAAGAGPGLALGALESRGAVPIVVGWVGVEGLAHGGLAVPSGAALPQREGGGRARPQQAAADR